MTDALSRQFGGSHYKKHGIQPVEFAMKNEWDFCVGSTLKYLTRWRDKAGAVDLQKAKHFVELRESTVRLRDLTWRVIPMEEYIEANQVPKDDAVAMLALDIYVNQPTPANRDVFFRCVDRLLAIAPG